MGFVAWFSDAVAAVGIPFQYHAYIAVVFTAACIALGWLWWPNHRHRDLTDHQLQAMRERLKTEGFKRLLRPPPLTGSERIYVAIIGMLALMCFGLAALAFCSAIQ